MIKKIVMKGIDVSRHNKVTDFNKVKADGVEFVIIRAGGSNGGLYKDPKFEQYYAAAKAAKLHIGAYYDTGKDFISYSNGFMCAGHFLELIKNKNFDMPLVVDIETAPTPYREGITDAAIAFCDVIEKNKGYAMIYASDISGFKERLNIDRLKHLDKWVARYGAKPTYIKDFGIWQRTSAGIVDGVDTIVDIDEAYTNYPTVINRLKLNKFEGRT